MEETEWLSFEKSGRVADYLAYCQSAAGKFSEYESGRSLSEAKNGFCESCLTENTQKKHFGL